MGFQLIPGHGLPADHAWLQPNDEYTRQRLLSLSDHWRHLVWFDEPALFNTLACHEEIAGGQHDSMDSRRYD